MDITGGTIVSGGSMSDMSGYTLTFSGMERAPANFLDAGDITGAGFGVIAGV